MVFFGGSPDLLGVDVVGEAGNDPLVFAAQHDHARVAPQVQRVTVGQACRFAFSAHIRRRSGSRVVVTVVFSQLLGPRRGRPRYAWEDRRREKPRELLRMLLLRGRVTKDHQPGFGLLVDHKYSRAEPAHRSLDTALGLQISWPVLRELLVGVGKLAGREHLASAGLHYHASRHPTIPREKAAVRAAIFPDHRRTELRRTMVLGQALRFRAPYRVSAP